MGYIDTGSKLNRNCVNVGGSCVDTLGVLSTQQVDAMISCVDTLATYSEYRLTHEVYASTPVKYGIHNYYLFSNSNVLVAYLTKYD